MPRDRAYPTAWDGSFYCDYGMRLARDVQAMDPDTFTLWTGDNSLFAPTPEDYQTPGELLQNANLRQVVAYMLANMPLVFAWQQQHGYTVPYLLGREEDYWTPAADWLLCAQNMGTGSGISDVFNALTHAGYPNKDLQDLVCKNLDDEFLEINLPSGIGSSGVLAKILGTPLAWRIMDPVFYIDPSTGLIQDSITEYANHLGGEWINMAIPPGVDHVNYIPGTSYLNSVFWGFFNNANYIYPLGPPFLKQFDNCMALGKDMADYCTANKIDMLDLVSPVPLTPQQKQFLSASQFYNPLTEHPPTFGAAAILETMRGTPPLVLATDPRADIIQNVPAGHPAAQLAKNKDWMPIVLASWAHEIHEYIKNQPPGRDGMEESLLIPFADAYDKPAPTL